MRGERALTIIGSVALWHAFIGLSFLAIGIATSMVYQLSGIGYRIITQSPTFPVDKFKFASSAACVAVLLLIGVFAMHRPDRSSMFLFSAWLGSLIGSLLYLAVIAGLFFGFI